MTKIIPNMLKQLYTILFVPAFCIIMLGICMLIGGYDVISFVGILLCFVFAIFWSVRVYYLTQSFCLEYGDGKISVCRVSGEHTGAFRKRHKDLFYISEIKEYGFSKELFGESREYHGLFNLAPLIRNVLIHTDMEGREISFCLKNGKAICFPSIYFKNGQLYELKEYIEKERGIKPKGVLASSLLVTKFTNEKINIFYGSKEFSKEALKDIELSFDDCNTYFTQDGVVIYDLMRVVYIPYNKLRSITSHESGGYRSSVVVRACCYWLANGTCYVGPGMKPEDKKLLGAYMKENHPEMEVDFDLIYIGMP